MSTARSKVRPPQPAMERLEPRVLLSATYYVDQKNPLASDSNAGTDPARPLLTISKAATKVVAGDTILIREGIYREAVALSRSGTASAPITMKGQSGERVVISGADTLTNWTQATSEIAGGNPNWANIYYTDVSWKPAALFQDDLPLDKGRTGDFNWWVVQGGAGAVVNDAAHLTQPTGYWVGAEIFYWRISGTSHYVKTIVGSAPGSVTMDSVLSSGVSPASGDRYYLQNLVELISGEGQWAVKQIGTGTYRVYAWVIGGGDPDNHLMEGARSSTPGIEQIMRRFLASAAFNDQDLPALVSV